ncbi:MAG: DNA alkylation repair protein [Acholeplasmatales bacterium]|jgi:3-methyladenine DNA glycosylase AlkD|nr:DNA alkylation repair protein [Acholeplasmatales bacterium]
MQLELIINRLEMLANDKLKKNYLQRGAVEPIYGVAIKDLKPIYKEIKGNNKLAFELYNTKNYDCMYLAGMILDVSTVTKCDILNWLENSNSNMVIDFIISVSLAECPFALELVLELIESPKETFRRCAYYTLSWFVEWMRNENINKEILIDILDKVSKIYNTETESVKEGIAAFLYSLTVSYIPLSKKGLEVVNAIYSKDKTFLTFNKVMDSLDSNKLGFKRKSVRC